MFGYRVVREVSEVVVQSVQVEIRGWEPNVGLLVQPNCERVPRCDQHPLSQVKFAVFHDKRRLYVLLGDETRVLLGEIRYLDQ